MANAATWIAVPTYWTHPGSAPGEELTIFDHPTPLDEDGTLARTLESFRNLRGEFSVLIVAAGAHPQIGAQVHAKVLEVVRPFAKSFPVYLASPANLNALNNLLPAPILKLDSYGNIRNVQLAAPYLAGAAAVVGIDDDEVVEIPDYLARVTKHIGSRVNGETVGGMAGPYFDRTGDYRLGDAEALARQPNIFLKKNYYMNEALKKAMAPAAAEIVKNNVAFGGNMVMSRATIARVCHDPYIPRGEDYDYVINAAMDGISFFFQPGMWITHLPPDSTGSQAGDKASKLVADIRRFIYMREKTRVYRELFPDGPLDFCYLMPYPGIYLDASIDLALHGVRALDEKYPDYRQSHSPEQLVADALTVASRKAREFFAYQDQWRAALAAAASSPRGSEVVKGFAVQG